MMCLRELRDLLHNSAAWIVIYAVVIGLPAYLLFSALARVLA